MGEFSGIEWTNHTFNPWIGCTRVSPACDHCYAEAWDRRYEGGQHWGAKAPRRRTSASSWAQPIKWNKQAAAAGIRLRVFVPHWPMSLITKSIRHGGMIYGV